LAQWCGEGSDINQSLAYRAVPWIGIHGAHLKRTKQRTLFLFLSFFGLLVITYMFYGTCYNTWFDYFYNNRPILRNEGDLYYPYLEMIELLTLIFIRTRISIGYFPKIITILNVLYLYYCFINFYPFSGLASAVLCFISMAIFFLFLKLYELPALEWNPFSFHTPAPNNTRQVYVETLRSRFSLGFDIWSVLFPPAFRSEFEPEEQNEIGIEVEPIQFDFSDAAQEEQVNNN